jgi:erythromycin esterase-like protein
MARGPERLVEEIRTAAMPLTGSTEDYDPLLRRVGDARLVLLGEATHGTHEFYRRRAEITKRLILERGFSAVAAEADWPDAYRVNRYVRGAGQDVTAVESLGGFRRFPAWMWRNADVLDFVGWLRTFNDRVGPRSKVGFYGLDLYSLRASMEAVIRYLDGVDPESARRARYRYGCFEHFGEDPQHYGFAAAHGLGPDCEREAVSQLVELQHRRRDLLAAEGVVPEDAYFEAEQNALVVQNAERYYRSMFEGRVSSWNVRDTHMADTLDALLSHLERQGRPGKAVVWAHNSHVGDARATEMGEAGEIDLGQMARERHPGEVRILGFTTYGGTVTAASDWGEVAGLMEVRPALDHSIEDLFHRTGAPQFLLPLDGAGAALREPRLERAIGVVYRPQSERASHYFHARLADQFDAVIHVDTSRALEPLERASAPELGGVPETYPSGV